MVYQLHRDNEEYFRFGRCLGNLHFHRAIELIYCINNDKPINISSKDMTLREGELLFVPPLVSHVYPPIKEHKALCVVMPVSYSELLEKQLAGKSFTEYIIHDKDAANDIFTHLCMLENCEQELLKKAIYTYVVARILSLLPYSKITENKNADFAVNAVKYIQAHYREKLTSKAVAKALGYNHCYFSTLFSRNFRSSFSTYLNTVRINNATALLSSKSVSETAELVGFSSVQSFYQNFKKVLGKTPSEYLHI